MPSPCLFRRHRGRRRLRRLIHRRRLHLVRSRARRARRRAALSHPLIALACAAPQPDAGGPVQLCA
eukprot:scaffold106273_cov36-Phaeocystis_antarctica.AAC.1